MISLVSSLFSCSSSSSTDTLVDDPLSHQTKEKIIAFVHSYLFADPISAKKKCWGTIFDQYRGPVTFSQDKFELEWQYKCRNDLARINAHETEHFTLARKIMYEVHQGDPTKSFEIFRSVLINPGIMAKEFELDPKNDLQVFSAQKFMQVAIRDICSYSNSKHEYFIWNIAEINHVYIKRMHGHGDSTKNGPKQISLRNRLIVQNDPVQKLGQESSGNPILDMILSRTYFLTPIAQKSDGASVGPTREEARKAIKSVITKLCESSEIAHVMQVLAILLHQERGRIFLSDQEMKLGLLGAHTNSDAWGNVAGCKIHVVSLINPVDLSTNLRAIGTFVHESLHFIFGQIVKNELSPVKALSEEEKLFDSYLGADWVHQDQIKARGEDRNHREEIWKKLVFSLRSYLPSDATWPLHFETLHTYRVESIVRVMQLVTQGFPLKEIEAVAPNLCKFYFEHSKPMIERFVKENSKCLLDTIPPVSVIPLPAVLPSPVSVTVPSPVITSPTTAALIPPVTVITDSSWQSLLMRIQKVFFDFLSYLLMKVKSCFQ